MKRRDKEFPTSSNEEFVFYSEYRESGKGENRLQRNTQKSISKSRRFKYFFMLCSGGIIWSTVMNQTAAPVQQPADFVIEMQEDFKTETAATKTTETLPDENVKPTNDLTDEEKEILLELEAALRERNYTRARAAVNSSVFEDMRQKQKVQWKESKPITLLFEDGEVTMAEKGNGYGLCLRGLEDWYDVIDRFYCGDIKDGIPEGQGVLVWYLYDERMVGYDGTWKNGYGEGADGIAFRYIHTQYGDGTVDLEYHTLTGNFSESAGDGLLELNAYSGTGDLLYQCQYLSENGIMQPGYSVTESDGEGIVYFLHYDDVWGNSVPQECLNEGGYTRIPSFLGKGDFDFWW